MGINYFRDYRDRTNQYGEDTDDNLKLSEIAQHMLEDYIAGDLQLHTDGIRILEAVRDSLPIPWQSHLDAISNNLYYKAYYEKEFIKHSTTKEFFYQICTWNFNAGFDWAGTFCTDIRACAANVLMLVHSDNPLAKYEYLPAHWKCPSNLADKLTQDMQDAIVKLYSEASEENKRNTFYIYQQWEKLAGEEPEFVEHPAADTPVFYSKSNQEEIERLVATSETDLRSLIEGDSTYRPLSILYNMRSTNNARNSLSSVQSLYDDLFRYKANYIENVVVDIKNAEMNRINSQYGEMLKSFSKRLHLTAIHQMDEVIKEINADDKFAWHILPKITTMYGPDYWLAISRKQIIIPGNDNPDRTDGSDEEFYYSHVVVKFNHQKIMGITFGGIGAALDYFCMSCHPHKSENGNTGFCWGNLGGAVTNAVAGPRPDLSGSETYSAAMVSSTNLKKLTESALIGIKEPKLEAQTLSELAPLFRIYDLRAYLSFVWNILAHVDYDNPYIYLSENHINSVTSDYIRDMGRDEREDVFGDPDYEANSDSYTNDIDCIEVPVNQDYYRAMRGFYLEEATPEEVEALEKNIRRFVNHIIPKEYNMYDEILKEIAKANETTEEVTVATTETTQELTATDVPF